MTLFQRWKHTAIHNKVLALGTLFYAGAVVVQICVMQRNAELEQRAWVIVQDLRLPKTMSELAGLGISPSVTLLVGNSGRTPAVNATVAGHTIVRETLSSDDLADKLEGQPTSLAIIGPGVQPVSIPLTSSEPFTRQTQIDAFNRGATRVYAIGIIFYVDVFGHQRKTKFCFSAGVGDFRNGMAACKQHNSVE
jgi:hypothetical protein